MSGSCSKGLNQLLHWRWSKNPCASPPSPHHSIHWQAPQAKRTPKHHPLGCGLLLHIYLVAFFTRRDFWTAAMRAWAAFCGGKQAGAGEQALQAVLAGKADVPTWCLSVHCAQ